MVVVRGWFEGWAEVRKVVKTPDNYHLRDPFHGWIRVGRSASKTGEGIDKGWDRKRIGNGQQTDS